MLFGAYLIMFFAPTDGLRIRPSMRESSLEGAPNLGGLGEATFGSKSQALGITSIMPSTEVATREFSGPGL